MFVSINIRMVESLSKQLTQSTELGCSGNAVSQETVAPAGGKVETALAVQEVRLRRGRLHLKGSLIENSGRLS